MEILKLLSANQIVAQIVSFLILLFILKKFLWKPVLQALEERKAKIEAEFKRIDDVKNEISSIKKDYEEKMSSIHDVAKDKMRQVIEDGRKAAEEIKKDAQENARNIVDDAKISIEIEIARARMRLKKDIVDLTIKATEEIIQQKLTEEQDKKIVMEFLDKIDQIEEV